MNGFSTGEEDSRGPADQICCLIDENERCRNAAGNASYSKRIQKTVTTRRLKLNIDPQVSVVHRWHKALLCISFTWSIQKNQKHSTIYRLCGEFSGTSYVHLWLPQGTDSVRSHQTSPKGVRRGQQWNRHRFARGRSISIASEHTAPIQEASQNRNATGNEQSPIGWRE